MSPRRGEDAAPDAPEVQPHDQLVRRIPDAARTTSTRRRGLRSWLTTIDHKRIGIMYLISMSVFFVFAMAMAFMMRLELLQPGTQFLDGNAYNRVLTLHGFTMIFLFIIPSIPAVFGNFFLPMQVGANDVAFPRLNLASWYLLRGRGHLRAHLRVAGRARHGLDASTCPTARPPTRTSSSRSSRAFILGWSSILTGVNFITTVHRLRTPAMSWFRMPLFVWGLYATVLDRRSSRPRWSASPWSWCSSSATSASASSTPAWAATRSCSSTCSGSTRTRPST